MMQSTAFIIAAFICVGFASPLLSSSQKFPEHCSQGPAYWCFNITTAKECGATRHCIQTVWEHLNLPPDNDDICTICKDMVKQARDQLQSNETQEELKEVFEGSCRLIPVKMISQECIKISDQFIPELIEALASQMNPQIVCATAGLCNSARIDNILAQQKLEQDPMLKYGTECSNCHKLMTQVEKKLSVTSDDKVLQGFLTACGYMGSLSSGCQNAVLSNFEAILKHIRQHSTGREVCDFAGVCKAKYHEHQQLKVEVIAESKVGVVVKDETCELCKQLVQHLRDVLVSNTTQQEFRTILRGLCKQTGNFKDECLSIVEEYYPAIYQFMTSELNPQFVCDLAGICHQEKLAQGPSWVELPAGTSSSHKAISLGEAAKLFTNKKHLLGGEQNEKLIGGDEAASYKPRLLGTDEAKIWKSEPLIGGDEAQSYKPRLLGTDEAKIWKSEPLIGADEAESYRSDEEKPRLLGTDEAKIWKGEPLIGGDEAQSYKKAAFVRVPLTKIDSGVRIVGNPGLPIERMMPVAMQGNKELCEFCQYFLHYIQEEMTSPKSESEIKELVDEACDHLPKVVAPQCRNFVSIYGQAIVALLAQEMDPSQLCPRLGMCPQLISKEKEPPTCPLCLFVMEQLEDIVKEDKTEANIRNALEKVCSILPKRMVAECDDMVKKYSEELIEMLISDFTPQEVCVYLNLCAPKTRPTSNPQLEKDTEIETNEIPEKPLQSFIEVKHVKDGSSKCVICEFVMTQLDQLLKDNATEEEIKDAVHSVCNYLPNSVAKQCNDFVYEYADMVIQLLVQSLEPKQVCEELTLCKPQDSVKPKGDSIKCDVCLVSVKALDKLLEDGKVEEGIDSLLAKVCSLVPRSSKPKCEEMIKEYGPSIAVLVAQFADARDVCSELNMCPSTDKTKKLGSKKCTWGPSYWCQSKFHAQACNATQHCQQKVWKS